MLLVGFAKSSQSAEVVRLAMMHTWLRDEGEALLSREQAPPF